MLRRGMLSACAVAACALGAGTAQGQIVDWVVTFEGTYDGGSSGITSPNGTSGTITMTIEVDTQADGSLQGANWYPNVDGGTYGSGANRFPTTVEFGSESVDTAMAIGIQNNGGPGSQQTLWFTSLGPGLELVLIDFTGSMWPAGDNSLPTVPFDVSNLEPFSGGLFLDEGDGAVSVFTINSITSIVPAPSSAVLLGMAGLAASRRRR